MTAIDLYARETAGFDGRVAHALAVLQSAAVDHAGTIVQFHGRKGRSRSSSDPLAGRQLGVVLCRQAGRNRADFARQVTGKSGQRLAGIALVVAGKKSQRTLGDLDLLVGAQLRGIKAGARQQRHMSTSTSPVARTSPAKRYRARSKRAWL